MEYRHPYNLPVVYFALLLLIGVHLRETLAVNKQMSLRMCTRNQTLLVEVLASEEQDDTSCKCLATSHHRPEGNIGEVREDYERTPGVGAHKLHLQALTWNDARRACMEESAHLAVINSKAEEAVLIEMLRTRSNAISQGKNKEQAHLGLHDFFQEGEWLTILGEPLNQTGYAEWTTKWYGPQPDNYQGQNCGALVVHGGMDDVSCDDRLAFFCEMPMTCAQL